MSAETNASGLVCSKGSACSVEAVSIAAAVKVMAAEPMREAAATTAIMFPFLLIDVSSSSCGWRNDVGIAA